MKHPFIFPALVLFLLPTRAGLAQNKADQEFIQDAVARLEPEGRWSR